MSTGQFTDLPQHVRTYFWVTFCSISTMISLEKIAEKASSFVITFLLHLLKCNVICILQESLTNKLNIKLYIKNQPSSQHNYL